LDPVSGLPDAFDQRIDGVDTSTALTWDAAGRLDSETTGGVVTDYGYDAAGQLTSVVRDGLGGGDDEVFTYDDLGRRLTQVDGAGTTTFAYDSGTGELASMTHPVDGVTTFDYDAAGRRLAEANPTTGTTTSYVYDPAGRLAEVDHDTSTDDWTETHVSNGDGLLSRLTVTDPALGPDEVIDLTWDPTMGIAQVAAIDRGSGDWDQLAYGQGRLASLRPDTTTAWFATDHLGSATTADTAELTAAESYGAWGDNRTVPTASLGLAFGYRGEATTGDHIYLRARTYQPATGQFLTRDPSDGVDGTTTVANPWHYTNNGSPNAIDPLGLRPSDCSISESTSTFIRCLASILLAGDGRVDAADVLASLEDCVCDLDDGVDGPNLPNLPNLPDLPAFFGGPDLPDLPDLPNLPAAGTSPAPSTSSSTFRSRLGGERGDGCDAHHIVPQSHHLARGARSVLARYGISVHDTRNGALIGRSGHHTLHTNREVSYVNTLVVLAAESRVMVFGELEALRIQYTARFPCGS
jgi:RHS repeat-associated protein